MCRPVLFESPTCLHRWFTIGYSCEKGNGFNNCSKLNGNRILPFSVGCVLTSWPKSCPVCNLEGDYDRNMIRMVQSPPYYGVRHRVGKKFIIDQQIPMCTMM
ncbi:hypothetical protein EMPG_10965 [Blastomyces silverae]|uniref:Uncharacterized protein n=1 Tax=Blastomyces silverae TaxID=2060906 RepID=A0A0H1B3A5_9EURO|nr:hypothetical protein EMPG_10965 [Blastomyces silverae]